MTTTNDTFSHAENTDLDLIFTLTSEVDGAQLPIYGATFQFAAATYPHGAICVKKTTVSGISADVSSAIVTVSLSKSDFPNGSSGPYYYFLRMTQFGKVSMLANGLMDVTPNPFDPIS